MKNTLPEEIVAAMMSDNVDLFDGRMHAIIKNAVEAGYAAGCEESARIVESKAVPLGHERRYFAKAIRDWVKQVIK